jgi:hypothetical protein
VGLYVVSDAMLGIVSFGFAYLLRFSSGLIPVTRGYPPFQQYVAVMPFVAVLVPLAYYFQGVYRLRRGRSRVDDFFLVFIGTVVAVILGVVSTLYVDAYHASPEEQAVGAYQVSRIVWAMFLVINIALTFGLRELVRELLERRWKAVRAAMKRVIKDKNLKMVRFDTLRNVLTFENNTLNIPAMTINSSLGFLEFSGTQSLDMKMAYYVRIPLKMVTQVGFRMLFNKKKEKIIVATETATDFCKRL